MVSLRANGVMLHCQQLGETQAPLLVMCHGLVFGSMATWYFTAAAKLATRFNVLLYDQRGHGKSELAASGYDLETMTDDLAALIQQFQPAPAAGQQPGKVVLVGHSYGALIALNYALRHPASVAKLALIDAPLPANHYVYPSMANADSRDALQWMFPETLRQKVQQGNRSAMRFQERMEYLFLQSTLRQDVAGAGDVPDESLRQLQMPVLCLYGRNSECLVAGERLARIIPQAHLQLLECGHFIPIEAPEAMTQALNEFL